MEKTIDLKIVILGEGGVGKTSIIKAFLGKEASRDYLPTIGTNTSRKDYNLEKKNTSIRISLWDFGGQKSFNPYNPLLYKNVDIAVLVFDISQPKETLENLKTYYLKHLKDFNDDFVLIIVGNKLDLYSKEKEFKNALNHFLNDKDHILLMSAKTGENVYECFELLIYTYLKKAEILSPDIVSENTAIEFINLINKDEKAIKSLLFSLSSIESFLKDKKSKPKEISESLDETVDKELKYYEFLKQEIQKVDQQKLNIFDRCLINLNELEKAIIHLKKSHIKKVNEDIKNLEDLLLASQTEFEDNFDSIIKLNREENELMVICTKLRRDINQK